MSDDRVEKLVARNRKLLSARQRWRTAHASTQDVIALVQETIGLGHATLLRCITSHGCVLNHRDVSTKGVLMTTGGVFSLAEARDRVDVGIVTMKREELRAVLDRFPRHFKVTDRNHYNISEFTDAKGQPHFAAVVRTPEQGDIPAQATAKLLINDLRPNLVVLIGIGGAKPEQEFTLGDVIIANRMFDFNVQAAKSDGTIEYAPRSERVHPIVESYASNLEADIQEYGAWNSQEAIGLPRPPVRLLPKNFLAPKSWNGANAWKRATRDALEHYFGKSGHDRQPIVFDGPIGSGSILMKDPQTFAQWLDKTRELKVVDMEISGVVAAARAIDIDIPVVIIRGISDVIGFKRDAKWTDYACHSAASFLRAFLTVGVLDRGSKTAVINAPASPAPVEVTAAPTPSRLLILPIQGVNFVRLGANNYEANAIFTFSLRVNLIRRGPPFTLMGFRADYIAPDGCYCLNQSHKISVDDKPVTTAGNYFDFTEPVPVTKGIVQVEYGRQVRPPLMIQAPADCDYGDVRVLVGILGDETLEEVQQFFRFEPGGNLAPIDAPREPPLLSDSILGEQLAKGGITQEEYDRAMSIDAVSRYQAIRFDTYLRDVFSKTYGPIPLSPELREFLQRLHRKIIGCTDESDE